MKFPVYILLSLLAFTSCGLLTDGNEGPRLTELSGKIVYSAEQGNETHLFLTGQEGTRQLTSAEGLEERDYYASNPCFSPDGQWVVYASNRASAWMEGLYRVRTDGSERQPLKDASGEPIVGNNPVFSPDGKQVAFNRAEMYEPGYQNEDIYVVELASGEVRKLTENTAHDTHPTWSPDGQRIAFTSGRDYVDADTMRWRKDLYVMNADGTSLNKITEKGFIGSFSWISSADLLYVVYETDTNLKDIFRLDIETGTEQAVIKDMKVHEFWIFGDVGNQRIVTIDKKHQQLPVTLQLFNQNEKLLKTQTLHHSLYNSALHFNWNINDN